MSDATITHSPAEVLRLSPVSEAPNGICFASMGQILVSSSDIDRMVAAVPVSVAGALAKKAY